MFEKARLKLTGWYLLIIATISLCFSLVIYRVIGLEIERFARNQRIRIERGWPGLPPVVMVNEDLMGEAKRRLAWSLVLINGVVITLSGGLGYILAGRTLKPIGEMIEEQNRFISDASHEIRTPLTSLKSGFEVYLREKKPKPGEARTVMKESVEEVNKLQKLSDGLLRLTRYQQSNKPIKFTETDVDEIIARAKTRIKSAAEIKNIRLTKKGESFQILGNPEELTDLLVILLDNAVKYSPKGSGVLITTGKTGNGGKVAVADRGQGIAEKDLPHIFDRFYRADQARSKYINDGYGLGLAIALKIAENHGAKIEVNSQVGKGSKFTVIFQKKAIG